MPGAAAPEMVFPAESLLLCPSLDIESSEQGTSSGSASSQSHPWLPGENSSSEWCAMEERVKKQCAGCQAHSLQCC